ncbi:MAG: M48 family metalloprotease [Nitrospinaceae bacterium]|nr:M48 family metallopeptidase [Nitrospinaceae bacterium]NIR55386.1 M48 family metallopeptidase [Nitrospinaceae bacterium]NIS85823.1 M48 family metallopeptidase [Nitrospinaceae bacterium]NIT82672.1 M48 family metallopeptidase [Nitrospinaceae bacterium]NIU44880.1 M48 family metallopeptidase [Nitrospinaceae bacterium]
MTINRCISTVLAFLLFFGCAPPPATEPPPVDRVPLGQELSLGDQAYTSMIKNQTVSQDRQLIEILERVGRQLAAVSSKPNLNWRFQLIESEQMQAFALPGGQVIITRGLLPVCANESGLAAVMSHVMAHALAGHGAERLTNFGRVADGQARPAGLAGDDKRILAAFGIHSRKTPASPYSPAHESIADAMGLGLMARAGYDPLEAQRFWDRLHSMTRGKSAILLTHPMNPPRSRELRTALIDANRVYKANPLKHGLGESFLYILSRRKMRQMNKTNATEPPPASPIPTPNR